VEYVDPGSETGHPPFSLPSGKNLSDALLSELLQKEEEMRRKDAEIQKIKKEQEDLMQQKQ
jgi:hypothetical protein